MISISFDLPLFDYCHLYIHSFNYIIRQKLHAIKILIKWVYRQKYTQFFFSFSFKRQSTKAKMHLHLIPNVDDKGIWDVLYIIPMAIS